MDTFGNTKKITKLAIFDFDGTLISTPLPDTGRQEYHDKTGKPWPHIGWWGKQESLDMAIFDMPTLDEVISDYERSFSEEGTAVIMLTGRRLHLSPHVEVILDTKGLKFDEYHYNRGGAATEDEKMKTMTKLLEKYNDVTDIEQWDDRLSHIPIFEEWGEKMCENGRLKSYKINIVKLEGRDSSH